MRWNLDALYKGFDDEFLNDLQAHIDEVSFRVKWANDNLIACDDSGDDKIGKLEFYIKRQNEFMVFQKLGSYCSLVASVDDSNDEAKKYGDIIRKEAAPLSVPGTLFNQYVANIGDEELDELIGKSELLTEHAFLLKEIKQKSKFLLSEKEEAILAHLKTTGSYAWLNMKNQALANMSIDVEVEGKTESLPLPAVRNLAYAAEPETRKAAYTAELESYKAVAKPVAAALNAIKGEVLTIARLRGHSSPLHMTLINSRMEQQTLEAMISAMESFMPSFRRYFIKKAQLLGHKEGKGLPFYDLFAPVGSASMRFSYDEAKAFILEHFNSFSKKMGDFAAVVFDNEWIDYEVRKGKGGGAFCANIHAIGQSRIMSNFDGSFSNVTTLAHELGHAYHGDCLKDLPYAKSHYTMPIAETASTFCETIITEAAMLKADKAQALAILEEELSSAMQVIIDIYSRYVFETRLFELRNNGPLSVDELNDEMLKAQKLAYGEGLNQELLHPYMWINKVHYYYAERNFYNFPYAYGQLFAMGLYARYKQEGAAFVPVYDAILAKTGAATLEQVGDLAGIDVRNRAFWESSLQVFEKKVDEYCKF